MFHAIEFQVQFAADVEFSPKQPLERLIIAKGTRVRTRIKPYVTETLAGPMEMADLVLENGVTTRRVPFGCFSFVD